MTPLSGLTLEGFLNLWTPKEFKDSFKAMNAPIAVTKKDVERRAWHYLKTALMVLLLLPVLYILALGPIELVYERYRLQTHPVWNNVIQGLYTPLNYSITKSSSSFGHFLRWYLKFWSRNDIPEPVPLNDPK
jgi:hypothetical protein